ncbi:hypothetical protein JEQ12_020116 [Ovis aries]|uniref:Uncharacterized protein n=1 Tax=Ovis aries TaxID=9940 RepID=A0A835ZHF8_SHEEP|nr:hypothetical protein JEQ12_020116 [Ovis aries]
MAAWAGFQSVAPTCPRPGMLPGSQMTLQGPSLGPPGYGGTLQSDLAWLRQGWTIQNRNHTGKKTMADKILSQKIHLLAFERKLDQTIMSKRLDIQEALKRQLLEDSALSKYDATKQKRKFSSFKSLVIELDKDLYGPDNHMQGDVNVRCTVLLILNYQPSQFKLDPCLAWHPHPDPSSDHSSTIFDSQPMKFSEVPQQLHALLMTPEPIIINHTACYDTDVKIHETTEMINLLKTQQKFLLSFARDPQGFINDWLQSQYQDLKTMTDFYFQPWTQETVCQYFYSKVRKQQLELDMEQQNCSR